VNKKSEIFSKQIFGWRKDSKKWKNLHFMGHRIVASEFLMPVVDFSPPLMLLAKLHV
jgi:hypothetical protein